MQQHLKLYLSTLKDYNQTEKLVIKIYNYVETAQIKSQLVLMKLVQTKSFKSVY